MYVVTYNCIKFKILLKTNFFIYLFCIFMDALKNNFKNNLFHKFAYFIDITQII